MRAKCSVEDCKFLSTAKGLCRTHYARLRKHGNTETNLNLTHGHSRKHAFTKEYRSWAAMKTRCTNPNADRYSCYGGRGIGYDPRWENFEAFLSDMGLCPSDQHSIDRIDVNANYSKENCRWATAVEQRRNKRTNVVIELNGVKRTMVEWSEVLGLSYYVIRSRHNRNYSPEEMLYVGRFASTKERRKIS